MEEKTNLIFLQGTTLQNRWLRNFLLDAMSHLEVIHLALTLFLHSQSEYNALFIHSHNNIRCHPHLLFPVVGVCIRLIGQSHAVAPPLTW